MKSVIYKILNKVNGKFYIGSSKCIEKRWNRHKIRLIRDYHTNPHLQSSWNKYGESNFELNILEECKTSELLEREQHYLDTTKCTSKKIGYNIATKAGKGPDCTGLRQYNLMKAVNQYNLDGMFIKTFNCAKDVESELGVSNKSISACCNRRLKSAGGFMWTHGNNPPVNISHYKIKKIKYTDELRKKFSDAQKKLGPNKYIISSRKEIHQYDTNDILIKVWEHAGIAAKTCKFNVTCLRDAANPNLKKQKTAYGYVWKYK